MKCPYCESTDIIVWANFIKVGGNKATQYRCYTCAKYFEVRHIKGCGDKIFAYGDNYPVFNKGDKMKEFEKGNKVKIKIDTGIYCYGEIIYADNYQNLHKVKYNDGYKDIEDIFKGEQLELIEIIEHNPSNNTVKTNCSTIRGQMAHKTSRGLMPKAKKDDLINLWIDLWGFMKDKVKKEIKE